MVNKIRTGILLGRGKLAYVYSFACVEEHSQGQGSTYWRLLVPDFLVDMLQLVLLKDNIYAVPRATK